MLRPRPTLLSPFITSFTYLSLSIFRTQISRKVARSNLAEGEVEAPWDEVEPLGPPAGVDARDGVEEQPRGAAEDEHVARVEPHAPRL